MKNNTPTSLDELLKSLPAGETRQDIIRAYECIQMAHGDRKRPSGETYLQHALAVTHIMIELGVDTSTIVASMLHDVLDAHTGRTQAELDGKFDEEVISLVAGLNNLYEYAEDQTYKLHKMEDGDNQSLEKVRRAILSIIEGDIRVILIRMAECIDDLRQANRLAPVERRIVATEAMNIYAPLANRLGIWQLKWQLEDLSFRHLQPQQYEAIANGLADRRDERTQKIRTAVAQLREKTSEMGLKAEVTGRPKHIYSIARKMQRKEASLDEISDIQALRVILEPIDPVSYAAKSLREKDEEDRSLCYQMLGTVHSLWQPIPREFDDYIATPKSNGYKSLHTAVIDKHGQTLEVQIRTRRMHVDAEKGIAAHWAYKEGIGVSASVARRIQSLRELLTTLRDTEDDSAVSDDLFETEVAAERIHLFTPGGDVLEMPIGSTPIDFAYQIHTQVGHRCRGAKVNSKMVSLDYRLQSGDRVEILTAKRGSPSRDWMNPSLGYTGSARTRSKIRGWFRAQERDKNVEQGREMVERELRRLGLTETYSINDIATALKYEDVEQFLAKVGFGDIQSSQISGAIAILKRDLEPDDELRPLLVPHSQRPKSKGLEVQGISGLHTKMAGCCNPVAPEPIVGFITRGQGVTIHRQDCAQVQAINEIERLIDVNWGAEAATYPIPIVIQAYRRQGLIDEMNSILRGQNILTTKTKTLTADGVVTVYLVVEVTSLDQLNWLLRKLESVPNVYDVQRQRWN